MSCLAQLAGHEADPTYCRGLLRDFAIMIQLFLLDRRYEDCCNATLSCYNDKGVGNGINLTIRKMKNAQREHTIIPIPETIAGVRISYYIRRFLGIAPQQGRLYRGTMMAADGSGHVWEPASWPMPIFGGTGDAALVTGWVEKEAKNASQQWNEAFQRILAAAVPGIDVRPYTAHILRVGGMTAGAAAGLSLEERARCAAHKSLESTKRYNKPTMEARRAVFARVGAGQQAAQSN